jgi:SAM-dependent methyltransferase
VTREQRLVFGEDAPLYDRARPGYPPAVFDHIVEFAGVAPPARVLEVGAGTGKATVPLAARGFAVVALEPSEEMAAVARQRCAGAGAHDVEIAVTSLEDWALEPAGFSVVYAATAWHWVTPEGRLARAHRALRDRGTLALFWNCPGWPDTPLRRAIDEVYERVAPELTNRMPGYSTHEVKRRACVVELEESDRFGPVEQVRVPWHADYTRAQHRELLRTQSNHRLLDPPTLERLLDEVGSVVEDEGGVLPVDYEVELYLARAR